MNIKQIELKNSLAFYVIAFYEYPFHSLELKEKQMLVFDSRDVRLEWM